MARRCVGLSTWFRLPDHMARHEVLCRGSAFLVAGAAPLLIASAHVVEPWRFPAYYPEEWVQRVGPGDVRYFLEARDASARIEACAEARVVGAHASRDAACLAPLEALDALDLGALGLGRGAPAAGARLSFDGHSIEDRRSGSVDGLDRDGADPDDDRALVPRSVAGSYARVGNAGSDAAQHFAATESALGMGMCGGPVVVSGSGACAGMVEGVVPDGVPVVGGHAAFIASDQLVALVAAAAAAPGAGAPRRPGRAAPYPEGLARDFI